MKFQVDFEQPVKVVRIIRSLTKLSHLSYSRLYFAGDAHRIINDDLVTVLPLWAQRVTDELIDLVKKTFCALGAREYYRERDIRIIRAQQSTQDVKYFLSGPCAARKNHNGMSNADEGLKPLLNIRKNNEIIHNGVRWLSGNDPWFRDTKVLTIVNPLLCMPDSCPLHGPFHGPLATSSADIQATQPHLIPDLLAVIIFYG